MKIFKILLLVPALAITGCNNETVKQQLAASGMDSSSSQIMLSRQFQIVAPSNGQSIPRNFSISGVCVQDGEQLSVTYFNGSSMVNASANCLSGIFQLPVSVQNVVSATGIKTFNVMNSVAANMGSLTVNIQYTGVVLADPNTPELDDG